MSPELMSRQRPSSSYASSSWFPSCRSLSERTTRARRACSIIWTRRFPLFAVKSNVIRAPSTFTCPRRIVARPNVPLSRAYDSAPRPERPLVEQPDRERERLLLREATRPERVVALFPQARQRLREPLDPVELLDVPARTPRLVIQVLSPPRRIRPERLEVPVGSGQIQTSSHAGGIASDRIRSMVASSVTGRPGGSS